MSYAKKERKEKKNIHAKRHQRKNACQRALRKEKKMKMKK